MHKAKVPFNPLVASGLGICRPFTSSKVNYISVHKTVLIIINKNEKNFEIQLRIDGKHVVVRVQIPQFDVRNEAINTRKKGKATKLDFILKIICKLDIYRKKLVIFLPFLTV